MQYEVSLLYFFLHDSKFNLFRLWEIVTGIFSTFSNILCPKKKKNQRLSKENNWQIRR